MYDKAALMDLVRKLALQVGQFKLASGQAPAAAKPAQRKSGARA